MRDKLLGKSPSDLDYVVVDSSEEEMLELGYHPVGKAFKVFLKDGNEYALARTEYSTGSAHRDFKCDYDLISLKDDLSRRDLTINAMAENVDGEIIDYFSGQADLEAGILRHISEAFMDDPLRVLRVARFAAELGFEVHSGTKKLMSKMAKTGMLEHLTAERIWRETEKALQSENPRRFFEVLDECGAFELVFPELQVLKTVEQPPMYHPEGNVWAHTLLVLDEICKLSNDPVTRFGALVHDVGKSVKTMFAHSRNGIEIIEHMSKRLKMPKKYKEMGVLASKYHMYFHRVEELKAVTILKWFVGARAQSRQARFEQLLLISLADSLGRGPSSQIRPQYQHQKLNIILTMLQKLDEIDYSKLKEKSKNQSHYLQLIHNQKLGIIKRMKKQL